MSFEYGIESTSKDVSDLIDEMESLILDFVATSALRCAREGNAQAVQLRSGGKDAIGYAGVVRIRYPVYGEVTSITNCDPRTATHAQGCEILNSKLLVTSIGVSISKIHSDIITVLSDAFRENIFIEFIPELLDTFFLGPDPEAMTLSASAADADDSADADNSGSATIKTWVVALSIGCSMLILMFLWAPCIHRHNQRKRKQTSEEELEIKLDGAYRDQIA